MEDFPALLPDVSLEFGAEPRDAIKRSLMTSGRIRQQLQFTREERVQSVRWVFSEFEWAMFQSWFKYKISQGADFFNIELPMGGETHMEEVQARFIGTPAYNVQKNTDDAGHGQWIITASLEVEDPPVMPEEDFEVFEDLGDSLDSLELAAARLANFVELSLADEFPA